MWQAIARKLILQQSLGCKYMDKVGRKISLQDMQKYVNSYQTLPYSETKTKFGVNFHCTQKFLSVYTAAFLIFFICVTQYKQGIAVHL